MRMLAISIVPLAACAVSGDPLPEEPRIGPAPMQEPSFYERLRDTPGPVPGLAGYTLARAVDAGYCGGFRIIVTPSATPPSPDEQPLASVYAVEFPSDLDFTPGHRDASKAEFETWVKKMTLVAQRANEQYAQAHDSLRMAQLLFRFASVLARAPIPGEVATGELAADKIDAYCEALRNGAEPLLAKAEQAAAYSAH